ncbi:MAG: Crp/Fnr family transcriptional regulator [Lachnospiraceae bacterium]|nr:Crp/Fnr family transcriptional regulator [Lachnospiraceae bacterium]
MSFAEYFPIFDKLTREEQAALLDAVTYRKIEKGALVYNGSADCFGVLLLRRGQLRAYICSEEGREVTVYRLFDRDICLLSASCMMRSLQFDITITAEKDTEAWMIPVNVYKNLMERSAVIANYTNEILGTRFTDVMWLVEQILWKSFDKRLAAFLMEESAIEGTDRLRITHEQIASHLGTAREVVTRMLKYFQTEGAVKLTRGLIEITDFERLSGMSE